MGKVADASKKIKRRTTRNKVPSPLLLLTDINDDCLLYIFECLDFTTLIKLCKLNQRFSDIIRQRIIPQRTIDFQTFSKVYSVRKVFKWFGTSMTRIVIQNNDIQITKPFCTKFSEFLNLILEYGEPGKLRQVQLNFGVNDPVPISSNLLEAIGPYFKNVHTIDFEVSTQYGSMAFNSFMNAIPKQNLRSLKIKDLYHVGDWLTAESLPNLRSFQFQFCKMSPLLYLRINSKIMAFLSSKPESLVEFYLDGFIHTFYEPIYLELSHSFPNLERLGKIMCNVDRTVDSIRIYDLDANNNILHLRHNREKFNFLNAFAKLKYVGIESHSPDCSDCCEIFRILATQNTIEELELDFKYGGNTKPMSVAIADIKRLSKLRTLYLNADARYSSEDFLNILYANLPVLTKCVLSGNHINQNRIISLIQLAKNLHILKIMCKVAFSASYYKKLLKIQLANHPDGDCLIIYIDSGKYIDIINDVGKKYKPSIIALKSL